MQVTFNHGHLKSALSRIAGQTGSGHISCDLCHMRHLTATDYWHHLPLYHIYEPNFAAQCQVGGVNNV